MCGWGGGLRGLKGQWEVWLGGAVESGGGRAATGSRQWGEAVSAGGWPQPLACLLRPHPNTHLNLQQHAGSVANIVLVAITLPPAACHRSSSRSVWS